MRRAAFYCLLQFAPANGDVRNIAVLLYDGAARSLSMRFRRDFSFAAEEDTEVLATLHSDLMQQADESDDPIRIIERFEETLSNTILITNRAVIQIRDDPQELLNKLYLEQCEPK